MGRSDHLQCRLDSVIRSIRGDCIGAKRWGTSEESGNVSVEPDTVTVELDPTTVDFDAVTVDLADMLQRSALNAIRLQLLAVAVPLWSKRRLRRNVRNDAIAQLCAMGPLSLSEMVILLAKAPSTNRDGVNDLLSEGRIEYLYPA